MKKEIQYELTVGVLCQTMYVMPSRREWRKISKDSEDVPQTAHGCILGVDLIQVSFKGNYPSKPYILRDYFLFSPFLVVDDMDFKL